MIEDTDIERIKASLLEEQRLETEMKKRPEGYDDILPLLHSLYLARMNLERANWGCSVDRNRFSLLKSSLLEEAHLEDILQQEGGTDTDLQKLLNIAKGKSGIYVSEIEANLDPTISCPLLPTKEAPSTSPTKLTQEGKRPIDRTSIKTKEGPIPKAKPITTERVHKHVHKEESIARKDDKAKRRQIVRYIMSATR